MARNSTTKAIGNRREQRLAPQQMELFAARIAGDAPDWPDLPKDAREALVGLMTRLILEHARTTAMPTMRLGAGHEH